MALDILGWIVILGFGVWRNFKLPSSLLVVKEGKTVYQMLKLAFDFGLLKRNMIYRVKGKDMMKNRGF